jgi:hypothetical protein
MGVRSTGCLGRGGQSFRVVPGVRSRRRGDRGIKTTARKRFKCSTVFSGRLAGGSRLRAEPEAPPYAALNQERGNGRRGLPPTADAFTRRLGTTSFSVLTIKAGDTGFTKCPSKPGEVNWPGGLLPLLHRHQRKRLTTTSSRSTRGSGVSYEPVARHRLPAHA